VHSIRASYKISTSTKERRQRKRPDAIIRDNEKRTCMLIDVAIPGYRNVIKKEAENNLKYKDLTIEIQRM
jgi:hypothetical protein